MRIKSISVKNLICFILISLHQIDDISTLYITTPYHPWYAKVGTNLTISCEGQERTKIDWIRQTQLTNLKDEPIIPTFGSNYIIQTLTEEPSGIVISKLIIKNVSLDDLGTYICKNDDAAFQVWIQVLEIIVQSPKLSRDSLKLGCLLNGFVGNIPTIDYDWLFHDVLIAHRHTYLPKEMASILHDVKELNQVDKYRIEIDQGLLTLNIDNPDSKDEGTYTCLFQLSTSLGTIYIEESFEYQDANLKSDDGKNSNPKNFAISGVINCDIIIFLILFYIFLK